MKINPINCLKGTIKVPGDKSISHRSIMIGSIAKGITKVEGFLKGADCLSTINCFKNLGININIDKDIVTIQGKGLHGLTKPKDTLDVGNSGTTIRLMSGLLSGQSFNTVITGDSSIIKRPMKRIITPLSLMGAYITSINNNGMAPLEIKGKNLNGIDYKSPIASAQVKSSIMLANLFTNEVTTIDEPYTSRNHSEIMINHFGGNIKVEDTVITCNPINELFANNVFVPADISSAAYFIVAALITPNSELILKDVGINPTRDGIIEVIKNMNGNIELDNIRQINGEKVSDIIVKTSNLKGTVIEKDIIPRLIDEIPIIAVAAAYADGQTIIKDAEELKVKESNRIDTCVNEFKKMNIDIVGTNDGMIINGCNNIEGAIVESYHDHRIAMSLAIAGLNAISNTTINNSSCINISYPDFFNDLKNICKI
jgi:3-phosphoshikimate 1-carboxyvinyltransferase